MLAGALGYAVYNYTRVMFGAEFNDLINAQLASDRIARWTRNSLLPGLDLTALAARFGRRTPTWVVPAAFALVAAWSGSSRGRSAVQVRQARRVR